MTRPPCRWSQWLPAPVRLMWQRRQEERARRRRCEAKLRELRVPVPFDLWVFLDNLAEDRGGRPIILIPRHLGNGKPFGFWMRGEDADYIVFELFTSRLHQLQIILHEVGHVVFGHPPNSPVPVEALGWPSRRLGTRLVAYALQRERGDEWTEEDQDAELLGSLVLEQASNGRQEVASQDPELADLLARAERFYGAGAGR